MDESKVPSISATEALLLDLMGDGEKFGLELVGTSGGRVKRGSVYVTLARMEAKGFVESRQEERAPGAIREASHSPARRCPAGVIALALGGEGGGSRLSTLLGMPVSGDTLLRLIRAVPRSATENLCRFP